MLPLSLQDGSRTKRDRFHLSKVDFSRRKSAEKFLCVKTFSGKNVWHSLAYLTVHKWLVRDVLFYLKDSTKMT